MERNYRNSSTRGRDNRTKRIYKAINTKAINCSQSTIIPVRSLSLIIIHNSVIAEPPLMPSSNFPPLNIPRHQSTANSVDPIPHCHSAGSICSGGLFDYKLQDHIFKNLDVDNFISTLLTGKSAQEKTAVYIDYNRPDSYLRQSLEHLRSDFDTIIKDIYDHEGNKWIGLDN